MKVQILNTKIKIICDRVIGDDAFLKNMTFGSLLSQSVSEIYEVLDASDGVFKRKMLMEK